MIRSVQLCGLALGACTGTTNNVLVAVDAGADAGVGGSRIWVSGDWRTAGAAKTGLFRGDATLPAVPSVVLPAGADDLRTGTGVVDLSADGTRLAYVELDSSNRSNLFIANGDGSSPTLVYLTQVGVAIDSVSLSPDGFLIAFTADVVSAGMRDLYVTCALVTDCADAFKMSPDRAVDDPAFSVAPGLAWSPTSRWLAFSGAMTEAGYNEILDVDIRLGLQPPHLNHLLKRTDILVPQAATGVKGVVGPLVFDDHNDLWYAARVANSPTPGTALFYSYAEDLVGPTPIALPDRTGGGTAEVGAIAISPDKLHVAYAADAPVATAYDVYYASVDAPTATTRLTSNVPPGGAPKAMTISPGGTRVAVAGDLVTAGDVEPFILDVAGADPTQLATLATTALVWDSDAALYGIGALPGDDHAKLFRLDPTAAAQVPILAIDVVSGGAVDDVDIH